MDWEKAKDYLDYFRTDRVMQQLNEWDINNISTNPWVLGGFAAIILFTYFIGMKKTSGLITGIGGFALVLSLAVAKGTGTEAIGGGGLGILIGGGVVAAGLFIYMFFIKSE